MLKSYDIQEFINELSSSSPAPGGGSAAALAASLAAALGSMVFNLTVGKRIYNELEPEKRAAIDDSLKHCNNMKDEFLEFMEKDTEAFLKLMEYFKLPKESDEDKAFRRQKINEGYKNALEVPFNLAERGLALYEYILAAAQYGNINAVSDAGVAALMLQAAIESAVLNVKINLSGVMEEEFKRSTLQKCNDIIESGKMKKKEIMNVVNFKLL